MSESGQIAEWLQSSLLDRYVREESVMLDISVPLDANTEFFRVGWSLRGARSRRWIAISTGHAVWSRRELATAAGHIESILVACSSIVRGDFSDGRRDGL